MTIPELVNNGTVAGDGTGETLFSAFGKVNTKFSGWIDVVADCGAVPDSSTAPSRAANDAAFAAAVDLIGNIYYGGAIRIPMGAFYFSTTWTIDKVVVVQGCGMGDGHTAAGSRLLFPANTTGIHLTHYSHASILRDFTIHAETLDATGHGFLLQSPNLTLDHVSVRNFALDGIHIEGSSEIDTFAPNAWQINTCISKENGRDGLHVVGNDVNAGVCINLDCTNNGRWGIYENSKFENLYMGCHFSGNVTGQVKDLSHTGNVWINCYVEGFGHHGSEFNKRSLVYGGGLAVYARPDTAYGSYPWISISGDGTGATAKALVNDSGVVTAVKPLTLGTGYSTATVTVDEHGSGSGLTITANIVGTEVTSYTVTNGGSGYAPLSHLAAYFGALGSGGAAMGKFESAFADPSGRIQTVKVNRAYDEILQMTVVGDHQQGLSWNWNETQDCYALQWAGTSGKIAMYVASATNVLTGGRSAALVGGSLILPNGVWLGDPNNANNYRYQQYRDAMPSTGEYTRGDFVFNTAPTLDANNMTILGWSRLVTGSNHVSGTDWAIARVSHVSPAT